MGMALLKIEPPEPVRSLGQLFALALQLEHDAAAYYTELAARVRGAGNPEVAAVFERLAEEKQGRAADVERRSKESTGKPPDLLLARWKPQGLFGEESTGSDASHGLSTAYRALSLAVGHEERAFAFWSYVVAHARDPAVRQAAAAAADEELHRASALRRERRRAFHAERRAVPEASERRRPVAATSGGVALLERELAARLRELAAASATRGDEEEARLLRRISADSDEMAEEVAASVHTFAASAGQDSPTPSAAQGDGGAPLRAVLRLAALASERYLAAAEGAKDEAAMLKAQSLAARAIERSALLDKISS
jgi:rubrerythrin